MSLGGRASHHLNAESSPRLPFPSSRTVCDLERARPSLQPSCSRAPLPPGSSFRRLQRNTHRQLLTRSDSGPHAISGVPSKGFVRGDLAPENRLYKSGVFRERLAMRRYFQYQPGRSLTLSLPTWEPPDKVRTLQCRPQTVFSVRSCSPSAHFWASIALRAPIFLLLKI